MFKPVMLACIFQCLGIAVAIAEFVVPSAGLLTVGALGLFGYSLYIVFTQTNPAICIIFVIFDAILAPVLIFFGMQILGKSPAALRKSLKREDGVSSQDSSLAGLAGKSGVLLSPCRPAGRALIDGEKYDVVSTGDFLEQKTDVVVMEVSGNRIVVARK